MTVSSLAGLSGLLRKNLLGRLAAPVVFPYLRRGGRHVKTIEKIGCGPGRPTCQHVCLISPLDMLLV